jgi:2-iminobutanoate/2-iminopropanoate deaminase
MKMTSADIVSLPKKWSSDDWQSNWVPGVRVGNVVYVSGITATDIDGNPVGIGDFKAQVERCLEKLQDVLRRAGGTLADVAKLTTYLAPDADADAVRAYFDIRASYFGQHGPASTGVTVHSLHRKEYLLEIDAIAYLKDD